MEQNPVFSQVDLTQRFQDAKLEAMHLALVVLRDPQAINDDTLRGIGHTIAQLSRLGMNCIVVLDCNPIQHDQTLGPVELAAFQADRTVEAFEIADEHTARRVDNILNVNSPSGEKPSTFQIKSNVEIVHQDLLISPLKRGLIPIIPSVALNTEIHKREMVSAKDVVLALTKDLTGLQSSIASDEAPQQIADRIKDQQRALSVDRIIVLDSLGAIPSPDRSDGTHVFINLEQEFDTVKHQLTETGLETQEHLYNLELIRNALAVLPPSSSGFLTTPYAVAYAERLPPIQSDGPRVRTRRQRNPLIHNLLTDKPAFSSSLPSSRSPPHQNPTQVHPVSSAKSSLQSSTLLKRGMPVTLIPDPSMHPWTPPSADSPTLSLSDPRIDLPRLVLLIEDSFNRKLDLPHYLSRIKDRLAGIVIAGAYEGGAVLTWETPPDHAFSSNLSKISTDPLNGNHNTRDLKSAAGTPEDYYVPYLDKFAVLRRSQGAGSVADIVFSTLVRECFPNGMCWRSRKDNPVNKWYFERSRGTWKLPGTGWTMFWTTEGVEGPIPGFGSGGGREAERRSAFESYESVCRGVVPSWGDGKGQLD